MSQFILNVRLPHCVIQTGLKLNNEIHQNAKQLGVKLSDFKTNSLFMHMVR